MLFYLDGDLIETDVTDIVVKRNLDEIGIALIQIDNPRGKNNNTYKAKYFKPVIVKTDDEITVLFTGRLDAIEFNKDDTLTLICRDGLVELTDNQMLTEDFTVEQGIVWQVWWGAPNLLDVLKNGVNPNWADDQWNGYAVIIRDKTPESEALETADVDDEDTADSEVGSFIDTRLPGGTCWATAKAGANEDAANYYPELQFTGITIGAATKYMITTQITIHNYGSPNTKGQLYIYNYGTVSWQLLRYINWDDYGIYYNPLSAGLAQYVQGGILKLMVDKGTSYDSVAGNYKKSVEWYYAHVYISSADYPYVSYEHVITDTSLGYRLTSNDDYRAHGTVAGDIAEIITRNDMIIDYLINSYGPSILTKDLMTSSNYDGSKPRGLTALEVIKSLAITDKARFWLDLDLKFCYKASFANVATLTITESTIVDRPEIKQTSEEFYNRCVTIGANEIVSDLKYDQTSFDTYGIWRTKVLVDENAKSLVEANTKAQAFIDTHKDIEDVAKVSITQVPDEDWLGKKVSVTTQHISAVDMLIEGIEQSQKSGKSTKLITTLRLGNLPVNFNPDERFANILSQVNDTIKLNKLKDSNKRIHQMIATSIETAVNIGEAPREISLWHDGTNGHIKDVKRNIDLTIVDIANPLSPSMIHGSLGFLVGNYYGAMWTTPNGDTDATIAASFYVRKSGNFQLFIVYSCDADNVAKVASGKIYVSADIYDGAQTWDISAVNADLTLPTTAHTLKVYVFASVMVLPDDCHLGMAWQKDDNSGGAAGNLLIYGIYLLRV